jgi:hypothetical protein
MRKRELEAMTVIELIDQMIWNTEKKRYIDRLVRLMAKAKTNSVKPLLLDEFAPIIEDIQETNDLEDINDNTPDYRALIVGRKSNGGWVPLVKAIQMSDWDRIDTRPRGATMYRTPDEVNEFLQDSIDNNFSYDTMTGGQCGLADTITHAFAGSWLRGK